MKHRFKKEQVITAYIFLLPLVVGVMIFFVVPIVHTFYYAFTDWRGFGTANFIGFGNFRRMFTADPRFFNELRNTFVFVVSVVPLSIGIALVASSLLNTGIKGVGVYRLIYFLPNLTMAAVAVLIWRWLLNSQFGIVNEMLDALFGMRIAFFADTRFTMASMSMVAIWQGVGYCIIFILAGLQGIDRTYYDAARIDGANGFQQFLRITVPLITPTIFFLVIIRTIFAFNQFELVYLLAETHQQMGAAGPILRSIETMVYGIFRSGFQEFSMGYACAKSIILFFIIMIITLIQFIGEKRWVNY